MAKMASLERILVNSAPMAWYHVRVGLEAILEQAHRPISGPLLEVGCGAGRTTAAILDRLPRMDVTALDIDPAQVERARGRLDGRATVVVGDVNHLAFDDASFGTVIGLNVLHHVADPLAALREIRRVLRPRGQFLFMGYAWASYPSLLRRLFPPESVFTRQALQDDLAAAGFGGVMVRGRRLLTGRATRPLHEGAARSGPV